jgi:uncharacterized protein
MPGRKAAREGVDQAGRTPLHYAAAEGHGDKVRRLLREGADPNAQDDNGWAPLHFAAQAVSADVAETLLHAGADPGLRDSYGNTPLHRAVFESRGDGSVIAVLRAAGADPQASNNSGVSPVALSRTIANYDVAQFFADVEQQLRG